MPQRPPGYGTSRRRSPARRSIRRRWQRDEPMSPSHQDVPMKIILFGATGMVGQGVLRECLLEPEVGRVLAVGRTLTGESHPKLHEIRHGDFTDLTAIQPQLIGYDACLFCLGVTSLGQTEESYRRLTYDITLLAATTLLRLNPGIAFVYVTGQGTDSSERGSRMWARVKGKTENDLLKLPFRAAYMFRPGGIQPLHGVRSKTGWIQAIYKVTGPLWGLLNRLTPTYVTTTEKLGRAMIRVVRDGYPKPVLETLDINRIGGLTAGFKHKTPTNSAPIEK